MNLIKAYKARTAKGTSLPFILLIITGYVAGIMAKIVSGQINYFVLTVYMINLIIVSINLAIYFRNRKLDSLQESGRKSYAVNGKQKVAYE
jgi:hypothetical protein